MKVFLGGTCNGSTWRDTLKPMLEMDYFDPVVDDWNEEAQKKEEEEKASADYCLYVITPAMAGVYSIAEAVDDSNKRPGQTILCALAEDRGRTFGDGELKSIRAVMDMIYENGGRVGCSLESVAEFLNGKERGEL